MNKILFVCTANRCRSLMAEKLFLRRLNEKGKDQAAEWEVASAGIRVTGNHKVDAKLITAMNEYGVEVGDHRSQAISEELIEKNDLILVMDSHHLEALQFEYPDYAQKIHLLSQLMGGQFDIKDPFGKDLREYQRTARLIDEILAQGFLGIHQLRQDREQFQ